MRDASGAWRLPNEERDAHQTRVITSRGAAAAAYDAVGLALQRDALPITALRVPEQQAVPERGVPPHGELQRLLGHQRADDARHGREHAVALAIAEPFVLVVIEARVARAVAVVRKHGDLPLDAHGGARDERHAARDARTIHREARREVVGAIEHDVDATDGGVERGTVEALGQHDDVDIWIHRGQALLGRLDLQRADILERIEDLPG